MKRKVGRDARRSQDDEGKARRKGDQLSGNDFENSRQGIHQVGFDKNSTYLKEVAAG
jgi:hypothetical protein